MADVAPKKQLRAICETIVRGSEGVLVWERDDRFSAAVSAFKKPDREKIHSLVERTFPLRWDERTVRSAPQAVLDFVEAVGGLRPGQELFGSDVESGAMLWAGWWPWGDQQTISLRIGVICTDGSEAEEEQLSQELLQWFGLGPKPMSLKR